MGRIVGVGVVVLVGVAGEGNEEHDKTLVIVTSARDRHRDRHRDREGRRQTDIKEDPVG